MFINNAVDEKLRIMELNKHQRECFLEELKKAEHDLEIQQACIIKHSETNQNDPVIHWFEMSAFLSGDRIRVIKKALIDNDIDF